MSRKTSSHILPGYAYAPETSSCIFAESKRDKKTRYCSIQAPLLHRVDNVRTSNFRCDIELDIKPINDAPLDVDIISRIDGVAPATTSFKRVKEWCIAEYGNRENFVRNKQKILETILQGYGQSDVARWKSSETIRCQQNQTDDEKQIMVSRKKIDDKVKKKYKYLLVQSFPEETLDPSSIPYLLPVAPIPYLAPLPLLCTDDQTMIKTYTSLVQLMTQPTLFRIELIIT